MRYISRSLRSLASDSIRRPGLVSNRGFKFSLFVPGDPISNVETLNLGCGVRALYFGSRAGGVIVVVIIHPI